MKPSNILINWRGTVKISDFNQSFLFWPDATGVPMQLANPIGTLQYRSPELILGHVFYGKSVDIWSCGCIMAELWTKEALFGVSCIT